MTIRKNSLFDRGASGRNLYQRPYAQAGGNPPLLVGEINLREDLDELFFGYKSGIRHGYQCLIRRLERDSTGKPIACTCLDAHRKEPDPDCSYCLGEGYIWKEGWVWTYSMYSGADSGLSNRITYQPPGSLRVDYKIFFLRFNANINYGDKIVEVKLDEEGKLALPYVRQAIYQPQTINTYRLDNSRIEYIAAYCRENDAIRLDRP